jgi:hypothetical protein
MGLREEIIREIVTDSFAPAANAMGEPFRHFVNGINATLDRLIMLGFLSLPTEEQSKPPNVGQAGRDAGAATPQGESVHE